MNKEHYLILFFLLLSVLISQAQSCADGTFQWSDIYYIFDEAQCTSCHTSPDLNGGFSGLSFDSYGQFSDGGDICGSAILSGNNLVSIIVNNVTVCDEGDTVNIAMLSLGAAYYMQQEELTAIQTWIDAGAPEFCDTTTTSIPLIEKNEILVYPIPSKNFIHVQTYNNPAAFMEIKIFDVNKKLV